MAWFNTYKVIIEQYLGLLIAEPDIGRDITYRAYSSSSYDTTAKRQKFIYKNYPIRGIKIDAGAEANLGPLWIGIKNYRSQASGSVQTGDFQYMLHVADFPSGFEPSTKDQIVDGDDTLKVTKADNIFNIAFLIVVEGSNVT